MATRRISGNHRSVSGLQGRAAQYTAAALREHTQNAREMVRRRPGQDGGGVSESGGGSSTGGFSSGFSAGFG